mmetsp:Transcript_35171/g.40107  ORF Transcript_35171/g.40107 Transcript_35171/m.40107 type:complete len:503 (-) Transcript_35171:2740-4248(-)
MRSSPKGKLKPGFIEKLEQLRSFLGQATSENDLENCLKQCGCDVNLAAMKLMTGEYKPLQSGKKRRQSEFFNLTSDASTSEMDKTKKLRAQPTIDDETSKAPSELESELKPSSNLVVKEQNKDDYLLCQRWINGVSRCKGGQVFYQEKLDLTCSEGGPCIVRLQGRSVEGTLPPNLCRIVTPLLRQRFIRLSAFSLMEEKNIFIGTQIPISISIFILNPELFFQLFDSKNTKTASARKTYFGNIGKKKVKRSTSQILDLSESAFNLLQWAYYGNFPKFQIPQDTKVVSNDTGEVSEAKEETPQQDSTIEAEHEPEVEEWAKDVVDEVSKDPFKNIAEMPDPLGFHDITLRPYQRQALSWMWKRETDISNHDAVEKELKLLSELARNKAAQVTQTLDIYRQDSNTKEIWCDCGPVLVSKSGAAKSTTIDGTINPLTQPLWQRRYLASDNMTSSVSFFVNELFGVASSMPPKPFRSCVGGIQADAMGLGFLQKDYHVDGSHIKV